MNNRILSSIASIAICLASLTPVSANTTLYSDLTNWQAVTNGVTTIDFTSKLGACQPCTTVAYLDGLHFDTAGLSLSVQNLEQYWHSGAVLMSSALVTATLPTGINSVFTDLMSGNPGTNIHVVAYSGAAVLYDTAVSTSDKHSYVGFVSTDPITKLQFSQDTSQVSVLLDNFRYGTASAGEDVAEPGTWLLLGSGLVAVSGAFRRRKRS